MHLPLRRDGMIYIVAGAYRVETHWDLLEKSVHLDTKKQDKMINSAYGGLEGFTVRSSRWNFEQVSVWRSGHVVFKPLKFYRS